MLVPGSRDTGLQWNDAEEHVWHGRTGIGALIEKLSETVERLTHEKLGSGAQSRGPEC